jgi:adenosylmethionine-8-amino-7-oxononanoate aminotransferase
MTKQKKERVKTPREHIEGMIAEAAGSYVAPETAEMLANAANLCSQALERLHYLDQTPFANVAQREEGPELASSSAQLDSAIARSLSDIHEAIRAHVGDVRDEGYLHGVREAEEKATRTEPAMDHTEDAAWLFGVGIKSVRIEGDKLILTPVKPSEFYVSDEDIERDAPAVREIIETYITRLRAKADKKGA